LLLIVPRTATLGAMIQVELFVFHLILLFCFLTLYL
jgi:hypothetical protein